MQPEKQRYMHSVDFSDTMSIDRSKILAIARSPDEVCSEILYPSIIKIHKDSLRKKE